MSCPIAFSRTRATKSLTTLKLTSASSSARRTSRIAASTSASLIRPRPVRLPSVVAQALAEGVEHGPIGTPVQVVDRRVGRGSRRRAGWCASSDAPRRAQCSAGSAGTRPGRWSGRAAPTHRDAGQTGAPLCCALVRNPFASPLWQQPRLRPGLGGRQHLDLRVAHHPHRAAAGRDPDAGCRARSRSPSCAAWTSPRHSSSGWWPVPGSIGCGGARCSSGRISGGPCCSARSRSRSCSGRSPLWQLIAVAGLAAVLTTFFDAADNAYLPTIVERERLVEANSALAASGSVAEFAGFGISGFLVQLLTGPITIVIDAVTYLVSAVLLLTVRTPEAPPPPRSEREPVLDEIRHGLRLVRARPGAPGVRRGPDAHVDAVGRLRRDVVPLRARGAQRRARRSIGIIAGVGGASSFIGAVVATRSTTALGRRSGRDRRDAARGARATCSSRWRRRACRWSPSRSCSWQQLVADSAITVYDVTETSVRQSLVAGPRAGPRHLDLPGRVGRRHSSSRRSARACSPRSSACG